MICCHVEMFADKVENVLVGVVGVGMGGKKQDEGVGGNCIETGEASEKCREKTHGKNNLEPKKVDAVK